MENRSRRILMMINNDRENGQSKAIDEPLQINNCKENNFPADNKCNTTITTADVNSVKDSSSIALVQAWIDNNDFGNEDSEILESCLLEDAITPIPTLDATASFDNQNPMITESNIPDRVPTPTVNATSGDAKNSDSSSHADFSPSEGSEYKLPSRGKQQQKVISSNRSRSSSSSSSSSSSTSSNSSSSSSSSNSSSSKSSNVNPDSTLRRNENNVEQESNKRQSRKRQKNTHEWKQNVTKRLKNCGQEYVTKRGKTMPAKSIRPPCKETCRLSCSTKISFELRNSIFKTYWDLGTYQRQRDFLASCVKRIEPAFRRIKIAANTTCNKLPRKPNASYYFMVNGNEVRVCKIFLLNTLSIGEKILRNITDKISDNALYIMNATDKRGKHGKQCKLSDEVIQSVRDHINSIPRTESHYLRANTTREFIDGSLTIAELHRSYRSLRQAAGKEAVNYDAYHRIFNSDFNLGLYIPRKDQCDECEAYKNAVDKEPLLAKHKLHLEEKSLSRIELKKDTEQCKDDNSNNVLFIFDLQAVLPCPIGQSSGFFYKSKLNCYNFTVSDANDDKTSCFFWHEGLGKRGANEIGTCLYMFLQELSNSKPDQDVIFYSDNCCGQQKNKFVFAMYYYAVNTLPLKSVTHKFLIRGHTQNKADSVHSVIEKSIKRAKKAGPIYTPAEYVSLIRNAKKCGNPYEVKEMNFDLFFDLKLLSDELNLNFNKDVDGNVVKLTDMKAIKFTKGFDTFHCKTSYKTDIWTEGKIKIGRNKKNINDIALNVLYTEKIPISNRKKEDIRQLIASNIVPKFYEQYYNSIFE